MREIGATLSRNKTRTFLTAFGIFWGTAMLAMLMGGASGLRGLMMRNFDGFATNTGGCFTQRTTKSYRGFGKGRQWSLNSQDIEFIRKHSSVIDLSTTLTNRGGKIAYGTKSTTSNIQGAESDYFKIVIPEVYAGRTLNQSDVSQNRKVAVIGKNIAGELFGTDDPIGKFISLNNIYFLVVGVVGQTSEVSLGGKLDNMVVVPPTTMQRAFNQNDDVDAFVWTARRGHSPKEVEPIIRKAAVTHHPIDPDDKDAMFFMDISEQFEMIDNLFLGIRILAIFVGIGTLLAGIIGIGNIMWIIVKERTQEIGIRRAIGAKPRDIISQILSESMVLTAIAGMAGICFATAVLAIVEKLSYDPVLGSAHFEMTLRSALSIMTVFLVLGTVAGIIPAIKAMRIKPIEALNDK